MVVFSIEQETCGGKPKLGTNYQRTLANRADKHIRKLLRSKDGLVFYPVHNPKVVSSNLLPQPFCDTWAGRRRPAFFFLGGGCARRRRRPILVGRTGVGSLPIYTPA